MREPSGLKKLCPACLSQVPVEARRCWACRKVLRPEFGCLFWTLVAGVVVFFGGFAWLLSP